MAEKQYVEESSFSEYSLKVHETLLQLQASAIIDKLALKYLIAEVASQDRTASEAAAFVARLRSNMDRFLLDLNAADNKAEKDAREIMRLEIDLLFGGIAFEETKK